MSIEGRKPARDTNVAARETGFGCLRALGTLVWQVVGIDERHKMLHVSHLRLRRLHLHASPQLIRFVGVRRDRSEC